jgi:D-3-phosphoglycerate dehydrogenase / 2-oxoglutarate reductase
MSSLSWYADLAYVLSLQSLGTAKQLPSLHQLLRQADFVTLHVPELPETKNMISNAEFDVMKMGSYLINASRGTVVDIPALIEARKSDKIAGFALDVYPNEPPKNGPLFDDKLNKWGLDLRSLTNIILTPHIGGSTEEAQSMIGVEVADALLKCTIPDETELTHSQISMREAPPVPSISRRSPSEASRSTKRTAPVSASYIITWQELFASSTIFSVKSISMSINNFRTPGSVLSSDRLICRGDVAYMIADISEVHEDQIKDVYTKLSATPFNIVTRMLY